MTQTDPLVSVVISFLNAERFLREAVESVLAQTYSRWEIFLVDDGSTDGSTRLALDYVGNFTGKIHYLEHQGHKNLGLSASRNLGIEKSGGAFVAFLDSDDVWLPAKLAEQVAIMTVRPEVVMVFGPSCWWYSWAGDAEIPRMHAAGFGTGGSLPPDEIETMGLDYERRYDPPEMFVRVFTRQAAAPCPSNILVRAEALRAIGGFESSFPNAVEDQAVYAKLLLRYPVFVSGRCWIRYRQHGESVSSLARKLHKTRSYWLFFLQWLQTYLRTQGMAEPRIWRALRREIWRHKHPVLARVAGRAHFALRSAGRLARRRMQLPS